MNNFFDPREVMGAAADSLAQKMGLSPRHPHPLANSLTLRDIATAAAILQRPAHVNEADMAVVARGFGTLEFRDLMAEAITQVSVTGYEKKSDHLTFCAQVPVKNFKPTSIPAFDADVDLVPLLDGAEIEWANVIGIVGSEQPFRLATYAKRFAVSRTVIVNDQLSAVALLVRLAGAAVSRLESRVVAATLEQNRALSDGNSVFHADFGNVVTDGLASGFGLAMAALRKQLTSSGQRADLKAKHLVVEPDLEATAMALVNDLGFSDITVSVLADLPQGRYYVLADQDVSPTIAVLRLHGATNPMSSKVTGRDANIDGLAVKLTADLGAIIMRRQGIVRGGA